MRNARRWLALLSLALLLGCGTNTDLLNCDLARRDAAKDAKKYKALYWECLAVKTECESGW